MRLKMNQKSLGQFSAVFLILLMVGCVNSPTQFNGVSTVNFADSCQQLAQVSMPVTLPEAKSAVISSQLILNANGVPEHCAVKAEINRRIGTDGKLYAINLMLRMPTTSWNGRFFMGGGGGTNGVLIDPVNRLKEGFATLGTDGGHDNQVHNDPRAGGTAAFGVDHEARVDFAYRAYDLVTQAGKDLVKAFYQRHAKKSYFMGCSEGGREALLMSQRFPEHYDGIISGAPVLHLPLGPMSGIYTTQLFAGLAKKQGHILSNGDPAIGMTYSDQDLMLVRKAVLDACDAEDGLKDGIVDHQTACTAEKVSPQLTAMQCSGKKDENCLSSEQIATLKMAYLGSFNSKGTQLYSDWQWDAGVGGFDGKNYNASWRSWWLGSHSKERNSAIKLTYATAEAVIYTTPPLLPIGASDVLNYSLNYSFDTEPIKLFTTTTQYPESTASMTFTDNPDLSRFEKRGGKLMVYHGASDSSISVKDTLRWYTQMSHRMGGRAPEFSRMYVVPGMAHCSGGPATDSFDMLPQMVDWVEKGVAPKAVIAKASNPGYFNVTQRTRPLCPFPLHARYKGTGDINVAENFSCQ
ncbi:MAG: tannase/feruloyl esterase family alpha/beta hydrolase [Betaproteobacteria bacterium]|nr:tannase/feruloyl esterase family alpha/beta hydrolase [Betaproteobacteria bacterium]